MTRQKIHPRLAEYNSIWKIMEDLYRQAARRFGLSECTFWILYSLQEENSGLTQSQLCYSLSQPKQTINSALKKMENEGYIELSAGHDRRRKQIHLTEKGALLAADTVDKVIAMENQVFESFSDKDMDMFLRLFREYADSLVASISRVGKE